MRGRKHYGARRGTPGIRHHGGGRKLPEFFGKRGQAHKRGHKDGAGGAKHH